MLPSFRWYVILVGHLPKKNLSRNPKIGFPFSLLPNHTLPYLWPMTHHSYIGWLQVGSAWALRVLHFRVRQKLVRCSCVCRGLDVHLCILPLIIDFLWRELFSDLLGHMCFTWLRTYVMILCNWLILWQNALYLYLGRFRMYLNTSRNYVSRSSVEAFKSVQENKLIVQIH